MTKKFVIFGLILTFLFCCEKNDEEIENVQQPDFHPSTIVVKVDERMELLAVVQHFTTWAKKVHTKLDLSYKTDVDNYFSKFSTHRAVVLSESLSNNNFSYDAPPAFVLYHSFLPDFKQITPYSDYLKNRAGKKDNLKDFAQALHDFAIDSRFLDFFNTHKDYYKQITDSIKRELPDLNYIKIIENYYGSFNKSYTIIVTPLFHSGGYGSTIYTEQGELIYSIQGPAKSINGFPLFGGQEWFENVTLHEFSHSFINPITNNNLSAINKYSKLFLPVEMVMKNMAYDNWQPCVNEHLVRVCVARLNGSLNGEDKKRLILENEFKRGFIYIYELDSTMSEYENYRDKYKTFEDFYSEIVKCFSNISNK